MHFEISLCQELIMSNKAVGVEAESTHADNYIWSICASDQFAGK